MRIYGLPNCDTCRKARKAFPLIEFVDYRADPVPAETLRAWAEHRGGFDALINKSSPSWRGLSDAQKNASTAEQWLALLAETPTLIKRPVLELDDGSILQGFNQETWSNVCNP